MGDACRTGPQEGEPPPGKFAERARAHHALVHELLAQNMGLREIARHLGWGRHTVQRYARAACWQDMVTGRKRQQPSKLDPFKPYLEHRWLEANGRVTVLALHREITERGFRGSYSTVNQWTRRALTPADGSSLPPAAPSIPGRPRRTSGRASRRRLFDSFGSSG
ncbi:hypothetical protein GA0115259_104639 [Streptomyces sp. MnatMP-M17]|nr:hypothetical protein GA0115259_104639 [Streptomyces sp. MnatMP-M17]